jgi:AmiR/NasT family two-component response regulator
MEPEDQRRLEQLTVAVEHRTTIGIAMGILMERLQISREDAFACLRRSSSVHNRKLYDIACEFVVTRELPKDPPRNRRRG